MLADPKIWIAVAFALFVAGFIKYALPFILSKLDQRGQDISHEINEAVRLREEAQQLLAEYKKKQQEVMQEADSIVEQAKKEVAMMQKHAQAKLQETMERRTAMAEDKIASAQTAALQSLRADMADIAIAVSRDMIRDHINEQHDEQLIEQALDDAGKRLFH